MLFSLILETLVNAPWASCQQAKAAPAPGIQPGSAASNNEVDLKDVLLGSVAPLEFKLKDLDGDWRRFTTKGRAGGGDMTQLIPGAPPPRYYYTRGDTLTLLGRTYIVAYRPQLKIPNMQVLMRMGPQEREKSERLTPETPLALSLVDMQSVGTVSEIRPFSMARDIREYERRAAGGVAVGGEKEVNEESLGNLKRIGSALVRYTRDYDGQLPPMKDAATVRRALLPYLKNEAFLVHPDTMEPYLPNASLSGKSLAQAVEPAATVAFYEANPAPDGTRGVLFLDGHAIRIPEEKWIDLKAASKIP